MENIFFTDDNGTFSIKQPENYSYRNSEVLR